MKKLLVFVSILFSCASSFSQNWMPFKTTDTIQQFVSHDSVPVLTAKGLLGGLGSYYLPRNIFALNSVILDTIENTSKGLQYVFLKGFSLSEVMYKSDAFILKGKIFGDTMQIKNNSIEFKTRDADGYKLNYPLYYNNSLSFVFGVSNSDTLFATVVSMDTATVYNGILDSIVRFRVHAYNNGNHINTHIFDSTYVVISKGNGLLETIDYTGLNKKEQFSRVSLVNEIRAADHFVMSKGDEFYYEGSIQTSLNSASSYVEGIKILGDTIIGNKKHFYYTDTITNSQFPNPPYRVFGFGNNVNHLSVRLDSVLFNTKSCYLPKNHYFLNTKTSIVGYMNFHGNRELVNYRTFDLMHGSSLGMGGAPFDSVYFTGILSGTRDELNIFGVSLFDESAWVFYHGQNQGESSYVNYAKIGNKQYGTKPYILSIGLNELDDLNIYYNANNKMIRLVDNESTMNYLVIDALGKTVKEGKALNSIDVSELKEGLYFVRLKKEHSYELFRFIR